MKILLPILLICLGLISNAHAANKLVPPAGKQLIGFGLAMELAPDPQLWRGSPGAVMSYTALPGLPGTTEPFNAGSGIAHLDALMQRHPDSALMLGLYLVNQLDALASGELDADIDRLIDLLQGYRRPVYLRFGYEFDGPWNRYDPLLYVAAWKRFRARLDAKGGQNIAMVWQSAADCVHAYRGLPIEAWYPGDDQVDWVAMSYFFPNGCGGLVAEGFAQFARRHGKPLMIAESTPRGYDLAGGRYSNDRSEFFPRTPEQIWGQWFQSYFQFIARNADVVRAIAYINGHWEAQPMWGPQLSPKSYWGDSRLETSPELLRRWRLMTSSDNWLWGGPQLFKALGYRQPR